MLRRLRTVLSHVARSKPTSPALVQHRVQWSLQRSMTTGRAASLARDPRTVAIGDVSVDVTPGDPRLVPRGRLDGSEPSTTSSKPTALSQDVLTHLRWMMQKDGLGQDMFLVGPPGPRRRQLAMLYCELVSREYEFVSITRDTTESDLKQRREIVGGSSIHSDQAPVRAALEGRILILEGIEKAERNVLPTLNNLLENREMALDDGRFLMSAARYDALLAQGTPQEVLDARRLVRVHPQFRVIAIGLPSPPFPGNPLDPPLRSRFQARFVGPPDGFEAIDSAVINSTASLSLSLTESLMSFSEVMAALEAQSEALGVRIPHFQPHTLEHVARVLLKFPYTQPSAGAILHRVYPFTIMPEFTGPNEGRKSAVMSALQKFSLAVNQPLDGPSLEVTSVSDTPGFVTLRSSTGTVVSAPAGPLALVTPKDANVIPTQSLTALYQAMLEDHACNKDICLIGDKGSGKSAMARWFAQCLGYSVKLFPLYADMSARDLLQRRTIDPSGNTSWTPSPLIQAAVDGSCCVLDGIDRLPGETTASLARLLQDREMELFDGTRLLPAHVYDALKAEGHLTGDASVDRVMRIHPSFRVVALALPPQPTKSWVHPEVLGIFGFHAIPTLSSLEIAELVQGKFPTLPATVVQSIVNIATELHKSATMSFRDDLASSTALKLSTRQLLRIARHATVATASFGSKSSPSAGVPASVAVVISESVKECLLHQFLPETVRRSVNNTLFSVLPSLPKPKSDGEAVTELPTYKPVVRDGLVDIGGVAFPQSTPEHPELVPSPLFFDIPRHSKLLRDMLLDVVSGDHHLLLIGNQGVGKNKLADRALQLLNIEREYMQLHRDSTVQSLTLSPSLKDGVVVWDDSPLVRAVTHGRTLVVDEIDKAPLEVVAVLKSLLEDQEMLLSDGRRVLASARARAESEAGSFDRIIPIHPNFRLWALANRPGYPFLGNNFFRECGDVFSSHVIDNPDLESERELVRAYAPSMPEPLIVSLTAAFAELRKLNEEGIVAYPYSTREIVAVAKHLEEYPDDGVVRTLENVLAFDSFDKRLRSVLVEVFQKHGIPLEEADSVSAAQPEVRLAPQVPLAPAQLTATLNINSNQAMPCGRTDWLKVKVEPWFFESTSHEYPSIPGRIHTFTEEKRRLQVFDTDHVGRFRVNSSAVTGHTDTDLRLHVLSSSPLQLHSLSGLDASPGASGAHSQTKRTINLAGAMLPASMGGLAVTRHGKRLGMGSVRQNEKDSALLNIPGSDDVGVLIPHLGCLVVLGSGVRAEGGGRARVFRLPEIRSEGEVAPPSTGLVSSFLTAIGTSQPWTPTDVKYHHPSVHSHDHTVMVPHVDADQHDMWRHCPRGSEPGTVTLWQQYGSAVVFLDTVNNNLATLQLPTGLRMSDCQFVSTDVALVRDSYGASSLLVLSASDGSSVDWSSRHTLTARLLPLSSAGGGTFGVNPLETAAIHVSSDGIALPPTHLSVDPSARSGVSSHAHLFTTVGLPVTSQVTNDQPLKLFGNPRESPLKPVKDLELKGVGTPAGHLVASISAPQLWDVEVVNVAENYVKSLRDTAFGKLRPRTSTETRDNIHMEDVIGLHALPNGDCVAVSPNGAVSVFQTDPETLNADLGTWRQMIGLRDEQPLTLSIRDKGSVSTRPPALQDPKHGKEDAKNEPHVGGSTWAGGTGGSNTAGLGGRGGPYRLDKGHKVHQVSDEAKREVSKEARERARDMAQEALAQRLKEIKMTATEASTYNRVLENVAREVAQLRVVLQGAETRSKERSWLKNQSTGDFDDAKLVDGAAGERLVYRRRGEPVANPNAPPAHPAKLHFVLDCSGSMYRFNGEDGRLNRIVEAAMLIMEGFYGLEHKYDYCIVGHSGDSESIPLVPYGKPPQNRKERLEVLETMVAHSQYCMSGDTTVEATIKAVSDVAKQEKADGRYVFVVSDANLRRYGISPRTLGSVLSSNPSVQAHAIFIASFGDEAAHIKAALPGGRGHTCMDTTELPSLFRKVFTAQFGV